MTNEATTSIEDEFTAMRKLATTLGIDTTTTLDKDLFHVDFINRLNRTSARLCAQLEMSISSEAAQDTVFAALKQTKKGKS
jgi:hypothetical protein